MGERSRNVKRPPHLATSFRPGWPAARSIAGTARPDRRRILADAGTDASGQLILASDAFRGPAPDTAPEALARDDAVAGPLDLGGGDTLRLSGAVTSDSFLFS